MKDLPVAMRPREKLLAQGPSALADAELLALLLRTGIQGTGVLQMAEQVLSRFGGLGGLLRAEGVITVFGFGVYAGAGILSLRRGDEREHAEQ